MPWQRQVIQTSHSQFAVDDDWHWQNPNQVFEHGEQINLCQGPLAVERSCPNMFMSFHARKHMFTHCPHWFVIVAFYRNSDKHKMGYWMAWSRVLTNPATQEPLFSLFAHTASCANELPFTWCQYLHGKRLPGLPVPATHMVRMPMILPDCNQTVPDGNVSHLFCTPKLLNRPNGLIQTVKDTVVSENSITFLRLNSCCMGINEGWSVLKQNQIQPIPRRLIKRTFKLYGSCVALSNQSFPDMMRTINGSKTMRWFSMAIRYQQNVWREMWPTKLMVRTQYVCFESKLNGDVAHKNLFPV